MIVYGAGKEGTRVTVNEDFTILIPYGCIYSTEYDEEKKIVLRVAKLDEIPSTYREGSFSMGNDEEEPDWVIELRRIVQEDPEKWKEEFAKLSIRELLTSSMNKSADSANQDSEQVTSLFGGSAAQFLGVHTIIDRADLKCGYGLNKVMSKLQTALLMGTPRGAYISSGVVTDMQIEVFLSKILRSVHLLEDVNVDEEAEVPEDDKYFMAVPELKITINNDGSDVGSPVTGLRFFLPAELHQWIIDGEEEELSTGVIHKGDYILIDIIERPLHCEVKKTEEGDLSVDLFIRSELGHFGEPDLGMTVYADGRAPEVRNGGRIGGDVAKTLEVFLKAAEVLRKAIAEQGIAENYKEADPEKEGFLVSKDDDQCKFTHVTGRKRPSMSCTTLFSGVQMGRPYSDETMDAWMREMMPDEELEELAESGDEAAMNDLANAYLNGDGVEQDFEKSLYWWKKLAECDDPTGQYNVGLYYAKGCGVEQDFDKAAEWMRKSAENGDPDAAKLIELFAKAGENLRKAEAGDADAQAEVAGLMMYLGRSVSVPGVDSEGEFEEAFKWAKKAADNGSGEGCWILGLAYEHGRGVEEDLKLAVEYFEKGASLGHAKCMGNLGSIYMNGQVKGKTQEDGFLLMKKAAELGDVHSMRNVGSCYQFGNGVEDSMRKAIYWYEKYLEHEEDEELARKVMVFKTLPDLDEEEEGEEEKPNEEVDTDSAEQGKEEEETGNAEEEKPAPEEKEVNGEQEALNRFREGIFVNGVPEEGKRVVVNNDFSVFIPYGCYYITTVLGTDNVVLKVGKQETLPEGYTDGFFKLYADEEDANWFIDLSILNDIGIENAVENGIPDLNLQETIDKILEQGKEKIGESSYNEALNNRNVIPNEKYIKCVYTIIPTSETDHVVITFILTTHKLYNSNSGCTFKSGDIKELTKTIFGSMQPLHVGESIEKTAEPFVKPSYMNNSSVKTSGFSIPLPDRMTAFCADSDEWYGKPEEALYKKYLFVAVDRDFEEGALLYRDAPMGIYFEKPRVLKDLEDLWEEGPDEVSKMLTRNALKLVSNHGEENVTRVDGRGDVISVFGTAGGEDSEPSWRSYAVLAANRKALLVGMVYFNCTYVDPSVTDEAMKEWLERFEVDENSDIVEDTSPVFDRRLTFDLPEGYEVERGTNDDGDPTFNILYDVTIDDDGDKKSKYSFNISSGKLGKDVAIESNIDSNFKTVIRGAVNNVKVIMFNVKAVSGVVIIVLDNCYYTVSSTVAIFRETEQIEKVEELAKYLTTVVNCMIIDGTRVNMSRIPVSLLLDEEDYSEFRKTDPSDNQHTHIDFLSSTKGMFSLFGATVNQNGTEYSFRPISDEEIEPAAVDILDNYTASEFDLSDAALRMSEIFRVDRSVFNRGHDREQEIRSGLISKASFYEAFRSFAWTLSAYCKDNNKTPGDVDYETLGKICRFIGSRNSLNYSDKEFSPAICASDDIHIYYLPAMSAEDHKKICELLKADGNEAGANVVSLDQLRSELRYLYPAVTTIYNKLLETRNDKEELEGDAADILYVWCSMTYAARRTMFSEDGPMNCFFEHPDEADEIPEEVRASISKLEEMEKERKKAEKSKRSQLSRVNQLIAESRKQYQEYIDRWEKECGEMIDEISSKSYTYEFEADADIRGIIRGRDRFARKLEALIKELDEKAGKIIKDEDDYASLKRISDYINEIFEDTPNLNISVDAYGDRSGKYKEDEYSFSLDSRAIYSKWLNKLHNTSQYKKEQEEKKRAEEERRKAEAERRKKEAEERRIREEKERKRREEEEKKAAEERARAAEEARKKAIADKYSKAIKDEGSGSKESLESAIAAFKELGDYEESAAHIESCRQKLDEVIRLEKEEEARRLEEEAQKKAQMKKIGIRIAIAAAVIALLLLIGKLTQAYLEEKARKDAYNNAVTLMEEGKYDEAIEGFKALEGYEDSDAMITEAENRKAYAAAEALLAEGKLDEAKSAFAKLGDYSDAKKRVEEITEQQNANAYAEAEKLLAEGKYDEAIKKFQELGSYSDSAKRVEDAKTAKNASLYKQAMEYAENEEYSKALAIFKDLGDYEDSAAKAEEMQEMCNEQEYEAAEKLMDEGDYQAAKTKFESLGDYSDASDRAAEAEDALEEQKEQEEIRSAWSEPLYFASNNGLYFVFTFEWSDGASRPDVYFEDDTGRYHLTITSFSKERIELYDPRGIDHSLTKQSGGGVYWRWESESWRLD